jgi:hypothetical protein
MSASTSIAPYLITAGATLAGVAITALFAEYRERRRSREERDRERERTAEERQKWLRQERRQSYASLIDAGYQAASLLLDAASRLFDGAADPDSALELWRPLDELRDSIAAKVADVELIGSKGVVSAAHGLRRTFRRAPDMLLYCAREIKEDRKGQSDLSSHLPVRRMFGAVHRLTDESRKDLAVVSDLDSSEST